MVERNLVTSLVLYESIRTTHTRARAIQPVIDRLITLAKKQETRTAIRTLEAYLAHENASRKMLEVMKVRYAARPSGFTRIVAVGARKGDGAKLVDLSLVDGVFGAEPAKAADETKQAKKSVKSKVAKKAPVESQVPSAA